MTSPRLEEIALPDFGTPDVCPDLSDAIYARRLEAIRGRMADSGLDTLIVYGDREHFANLIYLTGFDPRFEEAVMVLTRGRDPVVITGPENQSRAAASRIKVTAELYPPFGLLGQDRSKTPPLRDLLTRCGVATGSTVGVAGWKYFGAAEAESPASWLEVPAYIVDTLRLIVGSAGSVGNASALFMDNETGLRTTNEIDQLAQFEFAASHASEAIKRVLFGIRPGMSEFEAAGLMQTIQFPVSCHPMVSSGPSAYFGLNSPTGRIIEKGDPFTNALGLWGALTCRAGWIAESADDLPEASRDYVERLAAPYFETAAQWYETIGIGESGGSLYKMVHDRLGDPFFNLILNPGHLIHYDEWLNTPIYRDSTERLRSHQAIQLDIIPATGSAYFTANIEDGIALLDEAGRKAFAEKYPDAWARIEARRGYLADVIGIRLKPEVLPFSNLQGYFAPYFLSPKLAFVRR